MSWGWVYTGKRDAVIAKVREEKLYPGAGATQGKVYAALIAGVVAQLEALPEATFVMAESQGHVNEDGLPTSSATASIRTFNFLE